MGSPEHLADAEIGQTSRDPNMDILQPLQLLLAARRGVRLDPDFTEMDIPNDRNLNFRGKSGIECKTKRSAWWAQMLVGLGYFHGLGRAILYIGFFKLSIDISRDERKAKKEKADPNLQSTREDFNSSDIRIGLIVVSMLFLAFHFSRKFANKLMTNATPAHLDPLSYQFRLAAAMDQRGWSYREITTAHLSEMEKIWTTDKGISEKFTIKGLRYPVTDDWVYDINVVFNFDGQVQFSFPKANPGSRVSDGVMLS